VCQTNQTWSPQPFLPPPTTRPSSNKETKQVSYCADMQDIRTCHIKQYYHISQWGCCRQRMDTLMEICCGSLIETLMKAFAETCWGRYIANLKHISVWETEMFTLFLSNWKEISKQLTYGEFMLIDRYCTVWIHTKKQFNEDVWNELGQQVEYNLVYTLPLVVLLSACFAWKVVIMSRSLWVTSFWLIYKHSNRKHLSFLNFSIWSEFGVVSWVLRVGK
jgi:hypothetical protein